MIIACIYQDGFQFHEITDNNKTLMKEAIWIDLLSPSKEDENEVEEILGIDIPSREEMQEIELSSRLYKEDDSLFMTAFMVAQSTTADPRLDAVTFVLTQKQLITIRYVEPLAFQLVATHIKKKKTLQPDATAFFFELLDASVDRLADILEFIGHRLDDFSKAIFQSESSENRLDYKKLLQQIGNNGDLTTKARESLLTFIRIITFFNQNTAALVDTEKQLGLSTLSKDIADLSDHATFLSAKINFLLDATLGMVSIEQNNIIKIFSVAAVIFLPPTLIASIYGMNFHAMPELSWKWGYFFALTLMLISSWLPYKFFKRQKWL